MYEFANQKKAEKDPDCVSEILLDGRPDQIELFLCRQRAADRKKVSTKNQFVV